MDTNYLQQMITIMFLDPPSSVESVAIVITNIELEDDFMGTLTFNRPGLTAQ